MNRGHTATRRVQSHICVGTCCTKHKSIYFNLLLGWYFDDQLHFSDSVQLLTRSSLRMKCDVEFVLGGNLKKGCRGVRKCKKRRRRRRETFRSAASKDKPLIHLRVLNELVSTNRCQVWRCVFCFVARLSLRGRKNTLIPQRNGQMLLLDQRTPFLGTTDLKLCLWGVVQSPRPRLIGGFRSNMKFRTSRITLFQFKISWWSFSRRCRRGKNNFMVYCWFKMFWKGRTRWYLCDDRKYDLFGVFIVFLVMLSWHLVTQESSNCEDFPPVAVSYRYPDFHATLFFPLCFNCRLK